MAERTPGPWFAYYSQEQQTWTVQHAGGWIACTLASPPNRDAEANARFIVKACNAYDDLLAVCMQVLPSLIQFRNVDAAYFNDNHASLFIDPLIRRLETAINQVESDNEQEISAAQYRESNYSGPPEPASATATGGRTG
jgi:hypothetical protein